MEGSDHEQIEDIVSVALPGMRAPLIPWKYPDLLFALSSMF